MAAPSVPQPNDAAETAARAPGPDERSPEAAAARAQRHHIPEYIEHYRIIRRLGAGGMGVVFEAEQENPRRLVALKVVNAGVASPDSLRRFQLEAQVLGRLHHAGIAQIYEAGMFDTGEGGRPFFAMELVRGETITTYAEMRRLDMRRRLELLARVCDAVHHAHLKAIIHRDLKPGNILVTNEGQPKVLDFGVARATDADVRATTLQTQADQLIGTLPYMSPEQALGDSNELDMRSDIYALGVVGYELLTGRLPYSIDRRTVFEAVRVIREEEPTRLSAIDRSFRGDVETIFAKALEKDRNRRYQSASDLAADIRRFLKDEPIVARPPSVSYQLRKFARRHRALVVGLTSALIVLVAGVVVSTTLAIRESRALALARIEADKARAISDFHRSMLSRANPAFAQGRDVTVREVLDQAGRDVGAMFPGQPVLEATIRSTIGESYQALSEFHTAVEQCERAAALLREHAGADDPETLSAEANLAVAYHDLGRMDEAVKLGRSVLARREKILGPNHADTIGSAVNLAGALADAGQVEQGIALYRSSLDRATSVLGEGDRTTLTAMGGLAVLLKEEGQLDEAAKLLERSIELSTRWLGENDHDTLADMDNYAGVLQLQGHFERGQAILRDLLQRHIKVFGPTHATTLIVMNNLAVSLQGSGELDKAEELFRTVMREGRARFGETHPDVLTAMRNLAALLYVRGQLPEAERLLKDATDVLLRREGEDHPDTIGMMTMLAVTLSENGKNAEAEPWYRRALAASSRVHGPEHPDTLTAQGEFAAFLRDIAQYEESERLFKQTLEVLRRTRGDDAEPTVSLLYQYTGLLQKMERWQEALPLSEEMLRNAEHLPAAQPFRLLAPLRYGITLRGLGRLEEAEKSMLESLRRVEAVEGVGPSLKTRAMEELVKLYDQWNKPEEAAKWRARLTATTRPAEDGG